MLQETNHRFAVTSWIWLTGDGRYLAEGHHGIDHHTRTTRPETELAAA
ncbi:hypothetical protein [Micromonospora sp. NPDC047074]